MPAGSHYNRSDCTASENPAVPRSNESDFRLDARSLRSCTLPDGSTGQNEGIFEELTRRVGPGISDSVNNTCYSQNSFDACCNKVLRNVYDSFFAIRRGKF